MDYITGYHFTRTVCGIHKIIGRAIQFRYAHAASITADVCRSAAKAALNRGDLKRQLDLKSKCNGTVEDAAEEKKLLEQIAGSTDENLNEAMTALIEFYDRLKRRHEA